MPKPGEYNKTYPQLLEQENQIKLLEPFIGSKKHHKMQCMVCNHTWTATPISKRQTFKKYGVSGCPKCNKVRKNSKFSDIRRKNIETLKNRGIEILSDNYDGRRHLIDHNTYSKILVKNNNCGHTFECSPSNLLSQHVDCAVCGPQKRVAPLTTWSKENSTKWKETASEWELYKSKVSSITETNYKNNKQKINPKSFPRGRAGVEGAYHLDHIVPKRFCFDNDIPPEICADVTNLQMLQWHDNVGSRSHIKGHLPHKFMKYVDIDNITNNNIQRLIKTNPNFKEYQEVFGITATLYDDCNNIAILLIPTSKAYANQKIGKIALKEWKGKIQYFIIMEDELNTQIDLIINKISHYTHTNNLPRIHGRKCIIREVDKPIKSDFLNANHIQGNDSAMLNYGAFFDDNLVAVMTFSKPRVALGYKNKDRSTYDGIWELSRFATDISVRIPGIASKLLKHFTINHKWNKIISYADCRWSIGKMYNTLGFELDHINPPDYHYIINGIRKHRWNYRKDILKDTLPNYDASLTEYNNMENAGYWRVWDCGTMRFTLTNDI